MIEILRDLWNMTGFSSLTLGTVVMLFVSLFLLYLGIRKRFEPLLLIPIALGMLLANIPGGGMRSHDANPRLTLLYPEYGDTPIELSASRYALGPLADADGLVARPGDGVRGQVLAVLHEGPHDNYVIAAGQHHTPVLVDGHMVRDRAVELYHGATVSVGEHVYRYSHAGGLLYLLYYALIKTGILPPLIFLGVGAMTDFGPLLRNPRLAMFGAAAQLGIFSVLLGALATGFSMPEAASLGIIGGADGPTAIYLTIKLAPHLLGPIALAAYSYMALVPVIIPLIVRFTANKDDLRIHMRNQDRAFGGDQRVSQRARIIFPILVLITAGMIVPSATPLVGMLLVGNLFRECGVAVVSQRLGGVSQDALINICTIFLGLTVGATMDAKQFLNPTTLGIIVGGGAAFCVSVAGGVLAARAYNIYARGAGLKLVNPLIGATGLSAVPMASRVANEIALKHDPTNNILQYCMSSNVAGVIGSAVAAGVLMAFIL